MPSRESRSARRSAGAADGAAPPVAPPLEPPWWRPQKATGRRRQPLTRDAIVEAAVNILHAEGAEALTVRRLGEELNTGSATLYWHIGSKDELVELVYDHVMGEVELPEPDPSRWVEQVKDLARQVYRIMLKHNDLARLSIGRVPVGPNMLRVMEWSLDLLRKAGLPDQPAAYFGDMFGRYLDASVLEVTAQAGQPIEVVGQYFRELPADRFPNMAALSTSMFASDNDDRFEFGLDLLMRGIATHAQPQRQPRSRPGPGPGLGSRPRRGRAAAPTTHLSSPPEGPAGPARR
jgi:AcrR family transcriptional regulator